MRVIHFAPYYPPERFGGVGEFVARTALMISLVALSIDAMLPALQQIGADLGVQRHNDAQLVLTALFLGLAAGQMIYGPISDSIGRKPPIYFGYALFVLGCLLSAVATTSRLSARWARRPTSKRSEPVSASGAAPASRLCCRSPGR